MLRRQQPRQEMERMWGTRMIFVAQKRSIKMDLFRKPPGGGLTKQEQIKTRLELECCADNRLFVPSPERAPVPGPVTYAWPPTSKSPLHGNAIHGGGRGIS